MFTDEEYIDATRKLIAAERERVCARLAENPYLKVYRSNANFVLVKILKEDITSEKMFDEAIKRCLTIRDCSTFPFLNNQYFRFCFMLPEQNDRLLDVIFDVVK